MTSILRHFVRHRTAANLLLALMLLSGLWAGLTMRTQFLPDIVFHRILLTVAWPGAGPNELDAQIASRLDPALLAIEGVEELETTIRDGQVFFSMRLSDAEALDRALDAAAAAVDAADLPADAERTGLRRLVFADRVVDVAIWGEVGLDQLERYARALQAALFARGITQTEIANAPERTIRIEGPETTLIRRDLTIRGVAEAVRAAAAAQPAGAIGEGGAQLSAGGGGRDVEALGEVSVGALPDGAPLRLREVARIEMRVGEEGVARFVNGAPAVALRVQRGAEGDALAIQRSVEEEAAALRAELPPGIEVALTSARAAPIAERIELLARNGLTGLALVLGLLFLFLSARTAFWVAAGIPAAMAASLAVMHLSGVTLNMISLFALILALGIVVDDAIVVGEHADALVRRGLSPEEAAEQAAIRMAAPVFAASITTVVAFLALTAVGGRFGAMILAIPITISAVLIASLIESLLILPAHMRHALAADRTPRWWDAPSRAVDRGFGHVRDRLFRPALRWALRARYLVVGGAVALLIHSALLLVSGDLPWRFFHAPETGEVSTNFAMAPGATRADSEAMLAELARALEVVNARFAAEHGTAPVVFAEQILGGGAARRLDGADERDRDLLGGMRVELIDPDLRPYPQGDFARAWRAEIDPHPRLDVISARGERAGPEGEPFAIALAGAEPRTLKAAADELKAALEALRAVSGVEDDLAFAAEEIALRLTPRGEALGFTLGEVGRELRARLEGVKAADVAAGGLTAEIEVALPREELTPGWLWRTRLKAPSGEWASLSEIAAFEAETGFVAIRRENGVVSLTVSAEIAADDAAEAARARAEIAERILPAIVARHDVRAELSGQAADERDFLNDAALGFAMCLAGIYITLAWVFASWTRPLIVMLAIPFGAIGALWGHHWMGVPLSMFSVVGLIGMAGIVINDSIVLIRAADEATPRRATIPALVDAAASRLRAVFLTTATTVAGLAPMLFETSAQAQFLKPTAITLAFGLGFGMLLVLALTPAMLAIEQDIRSAVASARRLVRLLVRRGMAGAAAARR